MKKVFYSFHFNNDVMRAQMVRNIGAIDENPPVKRNEWEEIKKSGDAAVERWISDNMKGKECLVVLAGAKTAGRRWVKYEIKEAWKKGIGLLAVHIHNLKDADGEQSGKGSDPFAGLKVNEESVVGAVYDPPYKTSTNVYDHIASNIEKWVETAINARK